MGFKREVERGARAERAAARLNRENPDLNTNPTIKENLPVKGNPTLKEILASKENLEVPTSVCEALIGGTKTGEDPVRGGKPGDTPIGGSKIGDDPIRGGKPGEDPIGGNKSGDDPYTSSALDALMMLAGSAGSVVIDTMEVEEGQVLNTYTYVCIYKDKYEWVCNFIC